MRRRLKAEAGFIPTEQAKKILRQGGMEVADEQLFIILKFLYKMANESVSLYLYPAQNS
ncbi:hypothetical protein [Flavobacterium psychrotrophum]|uniref:hypothetical protein n=1 Tax=Flavobacterium psychrotrophum TaxID=2294119 RepID=UPI0013C4CC15|nr:hypothetical protein [Flavobacterium psychrotrophum]